MVHLFKTSVQDQITADKILNALINIYPDCKINFDLEDCDKILRIEGKPIEILIIVNCLQLFNHSCIELK